MKYMKKLMALLAALTLALAMAVPAFAESGTASSKGKITIDNAVTGTTYKAYRIFDLESYDTDKNAYSYKLNSAWNGFPDYSTTIDSNTVSAADFFSVNSAGYIEWKDAKKEPERILQSWQRLLRLKRILHVIRQKPQRALQ